MGCLFSHKLFNFGGDLDPDSGIFATAGSAKLITMLQDQLY